MAYIHPDVLDSGLTVLTSASSKRLDICTTEPTTRTESITTYTLGNKAGMTIGSPEARTPNGRKVVTVAISDGTVTGDDTAAFWGITDGTRLLAAGSLSAGQVVASGNAFTLAAFDIGIPNPA